MPAAQVFRSAGSLSVGSVAVVLLTSVILSCSGKGHSQRSFCSTSLSFCLVCKMPARLALWLMGF